MSETLKFDDGKVDFSDIPQMTLKSVAQVFNYGAKKYAKFNYSGGTEWLRYYSACQRHLHSWMIGEDIDESSHNHLDHAICSLMMLRENIHMNKGIDNRNTLYKKNNMSDGDFQTPNKEVRHEKALVEKNLGVIYSQPEDKSNTQLILMLIKMYPNDTELGAAIRRAYTTTTQVEQLDKEMD